MAIPPAAPAVPISPPSEPPADGAPPIEPKASDDTYALTPPDEGPYPPGRTGPVPGAQPLETGPGEEATVVSRFASSLGIALRGAARRRFDDEASANQAKARLKTDLPQQPSAYVPSGELPAPALLMMLGGAVLGVPAGAIAACVVLAAGAIICGLLAAFIALLAACVIWCLPLVALVICAIATVLLQYAVAGLASAWVITAMGKLGKNRNTLVPILFSLVSGGLAVLVFMFVLGAVVSETDLGGMGGDEAADQLAAGFGNPPVFWSVTLVGIAIAMVCAGVGAHMFVYEAKFCEQCELYMKSAKLHGVNLGGLRVLVEALKQGNLPVVVGVYASERGEDGTSTLFSCPECGRGFLDVSAVFKGSYKDKEGNEQNSEETWMVGSRELAADEAKQLQRFAEA